MKRRLRLVLLVAAIGAVAGYSRTFFYPTMYASGSTLLVVPQRLPEYVVPSGVSGSIEERLPVLTQHVLSYTKLERVINDFDLYAGERGNGLTMEDAVKRMKADVKIVKSAADTFSVGYVSTEPHTAQKVATRLASMFIDENVRDRDWTAQGAHHFIESQIDDAARRLDDMEQRIEAQRKSGRVPQSTLLAFEVLQATYRSLLAKAEETQMRANLERRQIGEQFKVIDTARMPERPVEDGRFKLAGLGALGGLALGIVFAAVLPRRTS